MPKRRPLVDDALKLSQALADLRSGKSGSGSSTGGGKTTPSVTTKRKPKGGRPGKRAAKKKGKKKPQTVKAVANTKFQRPSNASVAAKRAKRKSTIKRS
jgi:hypothetical protein